MATIVIGNIGKKMHTFQIVTTIFKIKNKRGMFSQGWKASACFHYPDSLQSQTNLVIKV